ncbi:unnamed protein product [Bursaphelenchus okinawaensis]|uniref:Uncharacterized protein n=1 Tax=Bursaphelenchus okinawaensis TaxID=465554 RepID=A0A811KBW8_9BILA|nr:unnamed protein product [Bursaphelenchus okinawaensis]CAG9097889.1 unnamed protein product [Bursaphelenchus okinawaensis]
MASQSLENVVVKYRAENDVSDEEFVKQMNDIIGSIVKGKKCTREREQQKARSRRYSLLDEKDILGPERLDRAHREAEMQMKEVKGLMYHLSPDCRNNYMSLVQEIYICAYHVRKWLAERGHHMKSRDIVEATYVMERSRHLHNLLRDYHFKLLQRKR